MAMAEVFGISSSFTSCSNISFKRNQQHPQDPIYQIIHPQEQNLQRQDLYQDPQLLQNGEDIIEYGKPRRRTGMKGTGGEIVQVQGGHIVRSTGRKDRHSKVFTAKGPRDRRVRLSAHTAIQFYDVQDRLGYDRPSKAVDWLIKKAKSAIDKLAELPPWHPPVNTDADQNAAGGSSEMGIGEQSESSGYSFQIHRQLGENPSQDSSFIDAIPDTMKSLFPASSTASSMNLIQSYPTDLISRTTNHSEDLGLSLHSFQDQGLIHGQSQADTSHSHFAGSATEGYEANFHRMVGWSSNPPPLPPPQQPLLGQDSGFSQRGPLQSSFAQSIRAWNDLADHHHRTQEIHQQNYIFGSRFAADGLPSFGIPARIHGEEEHSVVSERPSSSSPHSQH